MTSEKGNENESRGSAFLVNQGIISSLFDVVDFRSENHVPWFCAKLNCTKYSLGAVRHSFGSVRQENWNTYEIHRVRATNDWIPTTHVMYTAKITTNIVLGERVQQQTDFRSIAAVQSFSYSSGR